MPASRDSCAVSQAAAALGVSDTKHGGNRWFVQHLNKQQVIEGVPQLVTDWVDWQDDETWQTYAGFRQPATDENTNKPRTVRRLWRATGSAKKFLGKVAQPGPSTL